MNVLRLAGAVLALSVAGGGPARAQSGAAGGEWPVYGADNGATHYSPLDQIGPTNAGSLEIAWRWNAGNFGPTAEAKNEVTPLMVGGRLFVQAGIRRDVAALDAGTGETLWMWRMDEGARGEKAPRRNSGRGVAYWTDGAGDERIITVTPGFRLVALDADTGTPVAGFGENGVVDMMAGWESSVDPVGNLGSSSPAVVAGDIVIVGPALRLGFRPPTKENTPGHVAAYDVRTGERLWTFHTIPREGEVGYETWLDGSAAFTGNAGVWCPFSVDEELGYVYLPVEAPTGDLYGGHRPGDNLFSSSLVAVDVATGKRVWHQQQIHHDIWDYDNTTAPILMDVTIDGQARKIVVQLTKQAFAYVYDRVTGEPIWPIEERTVPESDVPGERTSPTQPLPTRPAPYDRQGVTPDDLVDFTPALREEALAAVESFRLGPLFAPPSLADAADGTRGTLLLPGVTGGSQWEAAAIDPETGVVFVPSATSLSTISLVHDPGVSNMRYIAGDERVEGPQGLPIVKPPYGRITAIDMQTGEHVWRVPNGDTPPAVRDHPALAGLDLPRTGSASRAGLVATRTLLFGGEGWGGQPVFRAYDKATGAIVAEIDLPAVQTGLPMTYMHDGRQFIVMTVGSRDHPAELVALALPDEGADTP